ncbi:hypothetical protein ES332_A03G061200v1 [Gossypium tomentosum]|uniref:Uncharacterized protein n=1 Tax=Gossypium tomentosum TaxID=34277 RepID=A0A5D2R661_GOSTO|nr:hypothetical protein ES332_A03G061200v1 [Gossypium tomentosum]
MVRLLFKKNKKMKKRPQKDRFLLKIVAPSNTKLNPKGFGLSASERNPNRRDPEWRL